MGMTIDDYKEHLMAIMDSMPDDTCGDWRDSLAFAIDAMLKYQKIAQIYQKWNRNYDIQTSSAWTEVIEVLEDGNDD